MVPIFLFIELLIRSLKSKWFDRMLILNEKAHLWYNVEHIKTIDVASQNHNEVLQRSGMNWDNVLQSTKTN
ncbi:MAG: hypothetical protein A2Y10_13295 [Planctomycetes bacterium GWF2_41_51]|nr:MAG: hypothetical protein A2Y10_13295 [Planctomycetes bacterium GWF2_41_51]HBG26291.1 hypothetical protein [Phycisphaerales bacterium]